MANTQAILKQIKISGVLYDIIAKSNAENVTVPYKGADTTLANALSGIIADMTNLPTDSNIDAKISAAIDELIGGAPETYDTLKEIADYIETHKTAADALTAAIGNKVDKIDGKGLSTEDFTTALKEKLDALAPVSAADVENWNNKVDKVAGKCLSTNDFTDELKNKLEGMNSIRYGAEIPADFGDGEVFFQIVGEN